jgi:hypothetical protein
VVDWSKTEIQRKKGAQDATRAPQQNPGLATTQRSTPEAGLKQTPEQKPTEDIPQRAQPNADLAASHNSTTDTQSQKEREHFQAAQEDAKLAADKAHSGQIQPLNPGTNEIPPAPLQPLDSSVQATHP